MTRFSLLSVRPHRCAAHLGVSLAVAVVAGCGSVGNTDSARLRAVNAGTDSGTSNLLVNGSASYGDQTYFNASSYFYISTGDSTFSAVVDTQSTSVTAHNTRYPLSSGHFYTAYLVGRPSASATGTNSAGYSQVLVADDTKPTLAAGQAAVRVIDAAPEAGSVDVLVNGSAPAPAFLGLTFQEAPQFLTDSSPDDTFVGTYVPVAAGTLSVRVNVAGTSTPVIPATNITVQAGRGYTLLVTEPTAGTAVLGATGGTAPTFALQTTAE